LVEIAEKEGISHRDHRVKSAEVAEKRKSTARNGCHQEKRNPRAQAGVPVPQEERNPSGRPEAAPTPRRVGAV
jgi:hypothetical protein